MIVTYKNNRLAPIIIIAICFSLAYLIISPSTRNADLWVGRETDEGHVLLATGAGHHSGEHHQSSSLTNGGMNETSTENGDVVLIMKTGATSIWRRLLIHLATSLNVNRISSDNVAIYSDYPESIGSFPIIDALANLTSRTKSHPDFELYWQQQTYMTQNWYAETADLEGDDQGLAGGWFLDKYKFLPLMQHAGKNWPQAKWYVFMEDDTYLFLPNVRKYLSGFDSRESHYLGGYAVKSDVTFAHGGSGFALSRGAWEASFGKNPHLASDYEQFTAQHDCGDQVLAHALNQYGVRYGLNGGDERYFPGFNGHVHWRFSFTEENWCSPLLSWHKVHARDVAQYYELEKTWDFSKPLLHRDFFENMILPHILENKEYWDNTAEKYQVTSFNRDEAPAPVPDEAGGSIYSPDKWRNSWRSVEACEAACKAWRDCLIWEFHEDACFMDDRMVMGHSFAASQVEKKYLKRTSGWVTDRLGNWKCGDDRRG